MKGTASVSLAGKMIAEHQNTAALFILDARKRPAPTISRRWKQMTNEYIFAVRDLDTGKLVSNITNPSRKYWNREGNCDSAISSYMHRQTPSGGYVNMGRRLKKVKFKLVEVEE